MLRLSLQAEAKWGTWLMGLSSRQRMWAGRSHLHIRSLTDGNKGRAGWINGFNDVPASQLSLSSIGLSAACCSVCWRCCDVAASLERTAESFTPIPLAVFCKKGCCLNLVVWLGRWHVSQQGVTSDSDLPFLFSHWSASIQLLSLSCAISPLPTCAKPSSFYWTAFVSTISQPRLPDIRSKIKLPPWVSTKKSIYVGWTRAARITQ